MPLYLLAMAWFVSGNPNFYSATFALTSGVSFDFIKILSFYYSEAWALSGIPLIHVSENRISPWYASGKDIAVKIVIMYMSKLDCALLTSEFANKCRRKRFHETCFYSRCMYGRFEIWVHFKATFTLILGRDGLERVDTLVLTQFSSSSLQIDLWGSLNRYVQVFNNDHSLKLYNSCHSWEYNTKYIICTKM